MEPQENFIKPKPSGFLGRIFHSLKLGGRNRFPTSLNDVRNLSGDELLGLFLGGAGGVKQMASARSVGIYVRIFFVAVAAYFLADTVSLFTDSLVPEPPIVPQPRITKRTIKTRSFEQYAAIINRNIFNSEGKIPEESGENGPAHKTNLPLNLIGTVVMGDELKSIASIEDRNANMVFPVRIDDTINNRIRITKIEHLRVYFINQGSGQLEYVEIVDDVPTLNVGAMRTSAPKKATNGVSETRENFYEIDKNVIDKSLSNMGQILQQARAIPNFENGMMDGFRLIQIEPNSIYSNLGIVENDIICGVNGEPMSDAGKAFQLFNELKNISNLELCIKRNGKKMVKTYVVK